MLPWFWSSQSRISLGFSAGQSDLEVTAQILSCISGVTSSRCGLRLLLTRREICKPQPRCDVLLKAGPVDFGIES